MAQTTPSGAAAPAEDEEGGPPGFGLPEATTDADMFSMLHRTPPQESFTRRVLKKVDSPLIREPPNQPLAKPVMP